MHLSSLYLWRFSRDKMSQVLPFFCKYSFMHWRAWEHGYATAHQLCHTLTSTREIFLIIKTSSLQVRSFSGSFVNCFWTLQLHHKYAWCVVDWWVQSVSGFIGMACGWEVQLAAYLKASIVPSWIMISSKTGLQAMFQTYLHCSKNWWACKPHYNILRCKVVLSPQLPWLGPFALTGFNLDTRIQAIWHQNCSNVSGLRWASTCTEHFVVRTIPRTEVPSEQQQL